MAQLLLLRGARQVLTLQGPSGVRRGAALHNLCVIEDGSVLISDGLIASVGSKRRIDNLNEAKNAPEISVENMIIMPGFVDPGLKIRVLLSDTLRKRKMRDFRAETAGLLRACMQHGTLSGQLRVRGSAGELRAGSSALRQLATVPGIDGYRRSWQIDPHFANGPGGIEELRGSLLRMKSRNFAQSIELTPSGSDAVDKQLEDLVLAARLPVHFNWQRGSVGDLGRAVQKGQPRAIFCESNVSSWERELLSKSPHVIVFSPESRLFGGDNPDSIKEWVEDGAAVALSTGYDALLNPTFSMQTALSLAVLRLALTAEQAITASTINAAHALGCADGTGSIEFGKRADLLVMNVPDYRELPRRVGINNVAMVIRGGNVVFNRTRWKPRERGAAA